MFTRRVLSFAIVSSAAVLALALSGCGMGGSVATQATQPAQTVTTPTLPTALPGHIMGLAHGGQMPVTGATVTLWAAGTSTGYGAGATVVASTTTDSGGNFNLDTTGTTSPCTNGQLNYITITGGNPGGGTNVSSALLAALPQPCSASTGSQYLYVNEATTVAAVWALQQFISITPGNVTAFATTPTAPNAPWMIGAPSTNVTGLTNAFATVAQLVNNYQNSSQLVLGNSVVASTVTGGLVPGTFYTMIAPNTGLAYTVANILSACVNTNSTGSTPSTICSSLFADVSPASALQPADTIQVAYDIATAPGGITEYSRPSNTSGTIAAGTQLYPLTSTEITGASSCSSVSNVGCEWALYMCQTYDTPNTVFSGSTTCAQGAGGAISAPTDFAIGTHWVSYDATGKVYGYYFGNEEFDSSGNIWSDADFAIAASTGSPIIEWDPQGHVLQAVGGSVTMPSTAWNVSMNTTTSSSAGGQYESTQSFTYTTPPSYSIIAATGTAFSLNSIAIDTSNNAWITVNPAGTLAGGQTFTYTPLTTTYNFYPGLLLKVAPATEPNANGTPTVATYTSATSAIGSGTVTITASGTWTTGEAVDLFAFTASGATTINGPQTVVTGGTGSFTISGTTTATGSGDVVVSSTLVKATSTATNPTTYVTGASPTAIAIDSANNLWIASKSNQTTDATPLTMMSQASGYTTLYEGYTAGSAATSQIGIDGLGFAWETSKQTAGGIQISRANVASVESTAISGSPYAAWNVVSATSGNGWCAACNDPISPAFLALDNNGNPWVSGFGASTPPGTIGYINVPNVPGSTAGEYGAVNTVTDYVASTSSGSAAANAYTGGLSDPDGIVLDGLGNVFTTNLVTSGGGGISEFAVVGSTMTNLSPTNLGTGMKAYGFNDDVLNDANTPAIDPSGNLWFGAEGTTTTHMIGLAAPVVTPTAKAVTPITTSITAWSSATGSAVTSITFTTASNNYAVGTKVYLTGFTTTTAFNNQIAVVTGTGASFTATLQAGIASTGGDAETGFALSGNNIARP